MNCSDDFLGQGRKLIPEGAKDAQWRNEPQSQPLLAFLYVMGSAMVWSLPFSLLLKVGGLSDWKASPGWVWILCSYSGLPASTSFIHVFIYPSSHSFTH